MQERVAAPHAPTWGRRGNVVLPSINQFLAGHSVCVRRENKNNPA